MGGIVQYPSNWTPRAYASALAWGGLVIADEVQTGFGRLGSHFWGFQAAGVTPDIGELTAVSTSKGRVGRSGGGFE